MSARRPRVLVAEDEPQMASIVGYVLEVEGFDVVLVGDGAAALAELGSGGYAAAVLDVMMPRGDGLSVCAAVRETSDLPILLLTARAEGVVEGLEAGADDYLTKPFNPRELALRVLALVRRSARPARHRVSVDDLVIDAAAQRFSIGGVPLGLTAIEGRVLSLLAERPGDVVGWRRLLAEVWEVQDWSGGREMVKAAVYRLRQRLGDDAGRPRYIETIRGAGYRLAVDGPLHGGTGS